MIEQDKLCNEDSLVKDNIEKDSKQKSHKQVSTQNNKQDLDQIQYNTQNFQISLKDNWSGTIMGVAFSKEDKKLLHNVKILLYYGDVSKEPVDKTESDEDGFFQIDDLPPGFYTLVASLGDLENTIQYIKVMLGSSIYKSVPL